MPKKRKLIENDSSTKKELVTFHLSPKEAADFRAVTGVDANATAVLCAARMGIKFLKKSFFVPESNFLQKEVCQPNVNSIVDNSKPNKLLSDEEVLSIMENQKITPEEYEMWFKKKRLLRPIDYPEEMENSFWEYLVDCDRMKSDGSAPVTYRNIGSTFAHWKSNWNKERNEDNEAVNNNQTHHDAVNRLMLTEFEED